MAESLLAHSGAPSNIKLPIPLEDGLQVEAVWYPSGTLCLSTQAGCALGCPFCASGQKGLVRNLSFPELCLQVAVARRREVPIRRLTLSGIGEPLHNLPVVRELFRWAADEKMPVSLTTTGTPLKSLTELLAWPHNGIMLSLHAGCAATHRRLIPHGPDWESLWELLGLRWSSLSRRRRRKVGINYLLLRGENDSDAELEQLKTRLRPFPELTVHLLCCNSVPDSPFCSPSEAVFCHFQSSLQQVGINVRRSNRWRQQADGGCGTLFLHHSAS